MKAALYPEMWSDAKRIFRLCVTPYVLRFTYYALLHVDRPLHPQLPAPRNRADASAAAGRQRQPQRSLFAGLGCDVIELLVATGLRARRRDARPRYNRQVVQRLPGVLEGQGGRLV